MFVWGITSPILFSQYSYICTAMERTIKVFKASDTAYLLALLLRYRILRIPLGLTYSVSDLEKDIQDIHIGLFEGGRILATLILTDTGNQSMKMRQVAVDTAYQSQGLGKELVAYAEQYARSQGYVLMHCHARDTARKFYLQGGYHIVGEPFTEVGIEHSYMQKAL